MQEERLSPSEVIRVLKCGVCWGFFNKPHTLKCGHSFCLRCLYRVCKVARNNEANIPLSALKFPCPTCRSPTRVRYILHRNACVNFAIQEYVNHWKKERSHVREVFKLKVRSIGCQYSLSEEQDAQFKSDDPHSPSAIEYNHVTTRLDVSAFLSDVGTSVSSASVADMSEEADSEFTVDTSTDDSDDLDIRVGNHRGRGRVRSQELHGAYRNFVEDIVFTFRDMFRSPNRSIMALIWCGYTISMMMIGSGFFPYMVLYSVLFLLILYAETIQQRDR